MQETIHYLFRNTSLGAVIMATSKRGICLVEFGDDRPELFSRLQACFPHVLKEQPGADDDCSLNCWIEALTRHLDHGHNLPDLPLDMDGTEFELLVWNGLRNIPAGQVLSYGKFAEKLGRPGSVRAVASACGRNRIGVLIPCHRVVRSDGKPGGYRWGISRKRSLLETESRHVILEE